MSLMERSKWEGRIFTGAWVAGSGGEYDAVEPATGNKLARVGAATPDDVHKAAESAAAGAAGVGGADLRQAGAGAASGRAAVRSSTRTRSHEWADAGVGGDPPVRAVPDPRRSRGGVLGGRRAGQPPVRPTDAVEPAAAVDGAPAPGRCGRGDRAVQRADHPGHPGHRAGARAGQRGGLQAGPTHGGVRRRGVRPGLRGGRAAAGGVPHAARRGGRGCGGRRSPADPRHRVHRVHPQPGGSSRGRPPSGSSGSIWSWAGTRR